MTKRNDFEEGYADYLSELAERVGGKVEVVQGVYTIVHKESERVARTSTSPKRLSGWLKGMLDAGDTLQAPPPRRGRKPGTANKSAKKVRNVAKKSVRKAAKKEVAKGE